MRYPQRGRQLNPPRPATKPLTDQQIFRADALWSEHGKSLGEIAQEIGCSVYQLGFLYRESLPHLRRTGITPIVPPIKYQVKYAIGFRDRNGIRDGYENGPFDSLKEAINNIPNEGNVILSLTSTPGNPPIVVAVWDNENVCWVTAKKSRG